MDTAPWYWFAVRLASVSPGSDRQLERRELPITWVTAIAEQRARTKDDRGDDAAANRRDDRLDHLQRVAPGPTPLELVGTPRKSSRQIDEVIGMIMIVST